MHTLFALLLGVANATAPLVSDDKSQCNKPLGGQREIVVSDEDARRLYDLFVAELKEFSFEAKAPIYYWVGRARREVNVSRLTDILEIYSKLAGQRSDLQTLGRYLSDDNVNLPRHDLLLEAARIYLERSRQRPESR